MKLFQKAKDGGPDSRVTGYWLIELKSLFSIVLLRFDDGSRDAYHSHAFTSVSWVLKGALLELLDRMPCGGFHYYERSPVPILTRRSTFHKVVSYGTTWVLSFRGPWSDTWQEYTDKNGNVTLTHGRVAV